MAYIRTMPAAGLGYLGYSARSYRRGLGASASQIVGAGGSLASPVVTAAAAPAVAAALGITASIAIPLVGAVFAGVLLGVEALMNSGCGQTCVVTSEWANQAEPLLKQNIAKYFSLPNRTEFDRQSALNIFDAVWSGLLQRCSQPGLGTAGHNCIADRQAGACKWKASSDSPYGGPKQGECWNWFSGYRDPIANDVHVASDLVGSVESAVSSFTAGGGGSLVVPAAIGALLLLAVVA